MDRIFSRKKPNAFKIKKTCFTRMSVHDSRASVIGGTVKSVSGVITEGGGDLKVLNPQVAYTVLFFGEGSYVTIFLYNIRRKPVNLINSIF